MTLISLIVFWTLLALVVYVYVGYPALVALFGVLVRWRPHKRPIEPSVSLVIAAYNESAVIAAKIRNALELDYPADRFEILVASDGSTDATAAITAKLARSAPRGRVRLYAWAAHRGKLATLNDVVPRARGDIVVFSDAASLIEASAIRRLVACFADPTVGAVSGLYRIQHPDAAETGRPEDFYWRVETFVKRCEARIGGLLGAHGALYAIRRGLYCYPSPTTINDDFVIPLRIAQRGYRVAYEETANVFEEAEETTGFGRRVRIMAGNIQQLRELGPLLWPLRPVALWCFLSHKAGRVVAPWALLALIPVNLLLIGRPFFLLAAIIQVSFYLVAAVGTRWRSRLLPLRLPFYFCMVNVAAIVATWRALTRTHRLAWR